MGEYSRGEYYFTVGSYGTGGDYYTADIIIEADNIIQGRILYREQYYTGGLRILIQADNCYLGDNVM